MRWPHPSRRKIGADYASPRVKRQIFQCRPWQRQTLQIRIIIQRIYSRYNIIWKRHISSLMWIYVDKRMWHTNRIQPRKHTKTLRFPHGKGNGEGYGTTPRPLNQNKRTTWQHDNLLNPFNIFSFRVSLVSMPFRLANTRRLGTNFTTNQDCLHLIYEVVHLPERATVPGMALAKHQALHRTSSSQATDEKQTASHRHPHESTLREIQLKSCINCYPNGSSTSWTLLAIEDSQVRLSAEKINV